MGCPCNDNANNSPESTKNQQYVVTRPNGTQIVVQGEVNARIEVTAAGGGTYAKV